jgi:hypothetical protein
MAARNPEWSVIPRSPLQNLFASVDAPFDQPQSSVVQKGSIVTFNYVGQTRHRIHDPYPLVIVSDIFTDMIRGVNLHYLTLPYVQSIVLNHANNPQFSFRFISGDAYIVGAFRSYKRNGISQLQMLDAGFLQTLLRTVRALNPGEIEQMRNQIHLLMQQQLRQPNPEEGQSLR